MYTIDKLLKDVKQSWLNIILPETNKDYFKNLLDNINKDKVVYPLPEDVFNAFKYFEFNDTKVCLLGMDPYINIVKVNKKNIIQANGLSFSVNKDIPYSKIPPSLKNIFIELKNDMNIQLPDNGDLTKWCKQGVLLLNCALTVKEKESGSHSKYWSEFSDFIIQELNKIPNIVFILLGNHAKEKINLIDNKNNVIIAGHPSPLNRKNDFIGSKIFSKTNNLLVEKIDW